MSFTGRYLWPCTLSLLLLSACSSDGGSESYSLLHWTQNLTDDSQCPLHLHSGQKLHLTLPTTDDGGKRWNLLAHSPTQLILLEEEDQSATEISWLFKAETAGVTHLVLAYQHPWALGTEPEGLFDCRIIIE